MPLFLSNVSRPLQKYHRFAAFTQMLVLQFKCRPLEQRRIDRLEEAYTMELILAHQTETQISVTCDGHLSHTFDLQPLLLKDEKLLIDNPVPYGQKLYEALFPPDTSAQHALALMLETTSGHILLVTTDSDLDAIPWEYTYGTDGFLVLDCPFVRGLPAEQRIAPPALENGLHIVAIPSNPLSHDLEPLNIDGEWMRLKESIGALPYVITLERTRPPSLERVRQLIANQKQSIIHFMGHGGQDERGTFLCFEKENGDLDHVTARQFIQRVRGTVFLVTLNACASAKPGSTPFSKLAAALVRQKTPYALGIRLSIPDEDAGAFSRTFYDELARGSSVEEALFQARISLIDHVGSSRRWVVGVPVLYTALAAPAPGFARISGKPKVHEHQPPIAGSALPRAEGAFQGRIEELTLLGSKLTGDNRPPLLTIHGGGGQGKTALAREAVERFAYAWPGGIWAISLENLPSRTDFVTDLARFLGIATHDILNPDEVERRVVDHIAQRRTLIVLDNAETLVEAVEANHADAVHLAQFLREQLPRPPVSILATSRSYLGWAGEIGCELGGLAPSEGVKLFEQHASQRAKEIDRTWAWQLSGKVEGHPLSLRLLSSAFNASTLSLQAFVEDYEAQLSQAENKYAGLDHRQRRLYTSIETSVRYLNGELRALLSGLWVFHAPFLAETAAAIFDSESEETESTLTPVYDRLQVLWQRGLLALESVEVSEGTLLFYRLLPTTRLYVEQHM
jgi:predicted ATPase